MDTAPLQLYSSAIIFAPEASIIRKAFWGQRAGSIGRVPEVSTAWGPELQTLEGHDDSVLAVAFSSHGKLLASASADGTIRLWNSATGEEERVLRGHGSWVTTIAFPPNSKLLASGSDDQTVRLRNPETGVPQLPLSI